MTREANSGDEDVAAAASPRPQEETQAASHAHADYRDEGEDDGEESDDDFELETMEDDDEDGNDGDDDELGEADEEVEETIEENDDASADESAGSLDDELMALVDDAAAGGGGRDPDDGDDDRIAHRTRTKVSLVNVDIDSLESLLPPDPVKSSDIFNEDSHEYQRFLSSLLPTGAEEDNLSFLDEEDEEYEPEEDEDDDDMDDDDMMEGHRGGRGEKNYGLHQQSVRVSKKELTELLWDSTQTTQQLKVPPTFPKTPSGASAASGAVVANNGATTSSRGVAAVQTAEEMADAAALKDVKGTISQQQCIQLASQMHKHFQLLLQTYYLVSSTPTTTDRRSEKRSQKENPEAVAAAEAAAKVAAKVHLAECESMLRELQIRGKRALQHKAQLLSKLTLNNGSGGSQASADDMLEQRRVTRSISAAHAAVAHPSMFDIVGSQSIDQLTAQFRRGCSITERNQGLQSSLQELDKHILLNRKKRRSRPQGNRKLVFSQPEDRLLFQGVKRHGVNTEAWREIHETLIPTKDPIDISKRYRYLCSRKKRGGPSAFKEYHSEHHTRKWATWMIEEDVRVTRGVVEYFGDNRRFARISRKYLPHRHRLEIRKRWERLKLRYLSEDGSVAETDTSMTPVAAGRVFAVAVKQFFENKLREEVKSQTAVAAAAPTEVLNPRNKRKPMAKKAPVPVPIPLPVPDDVGDSDAEAPEPTLEVTGCGLKNLHPALFFSSWAVINPATLLEKTCEHNWPAFINAKRQDITSESTLNMVSRAAVSRVEEETAEHRATLATKLSQLEPIEEVDEEDEHPTSDALDLSLDTIDSEDDGNDEESDFEQDELLSSAGEDTDSEYEQLEMSDDDDDDEDHQSVDDDEDTGDERSHAMIDRPLRVENLRLPDNVRAQRALQALERRLTGAKSSTTGSSTLDANGVAGAVDDGGDLVMSSASFDDDDNLDLFAYEELSDVNDEDDDDDDDDDEGFEQDELHSSSSSSEDESDEGIMSTAHEASERSKRTRDVSTAQPVKRVKLPRCPDCDSSPCVCTTPRMQRLMQRIQPQDGVHESLE